MRAVCRELGVSEATYHRWRNQFGGLKAEDAKRLKDLVTLPSTPTDQSEQRRTVTNAYSQVAGMLEQVRTQPNWASGSRHNIPSPTPKIPI
jgi:transposase-like protein